MILRASICHVIEVRSRGCLITGVRVRLRLHGRGFQSKRFHDLETASKTTRFQSVYTEPMQPLNPTVYVKAISFSGLCASSVGSRFDQTWVRRLSLPGRIQNRRLAFLFVTLQERIDEKVNISRHLCLLLGHGSRFIVKYPKAAKAKLNHRSKLWLCSKALHSVRDLPYLLREPANFVPDRF